MNKTKLRFALFVASICLCVSSWAERVAPTFPEFTTFEAGKSFCLYNVDAGKFYLCDGSGPSLGTYGTTVQMLEKSEGGYSIQLLDGSYPDWFLTVGSDYSVYPYSYPGFTGTPFNIIKSSDHYLIQRYEYSNDNEYLGYDGEYLWINMTEGSIHWKFVDAEVAKHYFARHKLYTALEATNPYNYPTEYYEAIYEDAESTTEELEEAARILTNGLALTLSYQQKEWTDYPVLFGKGDGTEYDGTGVTAKALNPEEEDSITATITIDKESKLVYDFGISDLICSVYIDGEEVRNIIGDYGPVHRFFDRLSAGTHHILWKFKYTGDYYIDATISNVGIISIPETISVSLLEPGSLGTEVLYHVNHIKDVRSLKVNGNMNADDWSKITMMTNLHSLDLSGTGVTEIPEKQFRVENDKCQFLYEIVLPNGLETISDRAFEYSYVDNFIFPSTLKSLGEYAFASSNIKEAILPDSMTSIGSYAFNNCYYLVNARYPKGLTYIPSYCFYSCDNLNTFELPYGLMEIGARAFYNNVNFNPRLPETLTTIGYETFYNCGTDSLFIPESLTSWGKSQSRNGTFSNNTKLVYAEFPTSFYNIFASGTIGSCRSLETLVLKSPTVVAGDCKDGFLDGATEGNVTIKVPFFLVNSYKLDEYWYNYNIEGFNTEEIKNWNVRGNMVLNNRERIEGNPNISLYETGSIKINGENAQNIDDLNLYVDHTTTRNLNGSKEYKYGMLLINNDAVSVGGKYMHHHKVNKNTWYFLSLPFDFKVGEVTNNSNAKMAIRYYDGASRATDGPVGNWKNYASEDVVQAGTGFIVQTSVATTLTFCAIENDNKQNVVSNEEFRKSLAANASAVASNKGWNLVGNPWQCYYNIHTLNFTAPITVYDISNKTYVAYSIIDDDYAIRPNEALFVQCPEGTEYISFPETGRQLTNEIINQSGARPQYSVGLNRQLVDISISANDLTDRTRIVLNDEASATYDASLDASKFFSMDASVPQIYSLDIEGTEYAINERPLADGNIKLGVVVAESGKHVICMQRNDAKSVVLIDHESGVSHDLSSGDYTFVAEAGTYNGRFTIVMSQTPVTGVENVNIENASVHSNGNAIYVDGIDGIVEVYTVDGRKVAETKSNGTATFTNMHNGIYLVRTAKGTCKVTVK